MTDITELAQREKFEAWVITQICISKSTLEGLRTSDGYRNSTLSGRDYNLMWNLWKAAGAELVEVLEKAQTKAIAQGRTACELFDEVTALRQRIAELESRTVKLPDDEDGQAYGFGKWANGKLPATAGTMTIAYCEDAWRAAFEVFSSAAGIKVEAE